MEITINQDIIAHLVKENGYEYNLHKASEECLELALILSQRLTKSENKAPDQDIIDEIGDVLIRVEVLKHFFSIDKIQERIEKKLSKYQGFIDHKFYKDI